ncbi:MAG: hypothetical protein ACFFEO_13035 [Candidatus Thorarchaeota archaeon]
MFIFRGWWALKNGSLVQTLPIHQTFHGYCEELNTIAISNNGLFIVSASRERMVKVWMEFNAFLEVINENQ